MQTVKILETFLSVQGESSYAGFTCYFIRFAGCNLRCSYCDTPEAWEGGNDVPVEQVTNDACASEARIIEITGGEPLMQDGFRELAAGLLKKSGRPVLVETNGSVDISSVPSGIVIVLDIKCPGSGEHESVDFENVRRLRPHDEVKFVIKDRADYEWAKRVVQRYDLCAKGRNVFFSPVWSVMQASELAGWIVEDLLHVRFQVQVHKMAGLK